MLCGKFLCIINWSDEKIIRLSDNPCIQHILLSGSIAENYTVHVSFHFLLACLSKMDINTEQRAMLHHRGRNECYSQNDVGGLSTTSYSVKNKRKQ